MTAEDIYMIRYAVLEGSNLDPDRPRDRDELRSIAGFLLAEVAPGAKLEDVLPELARAVEIPDLVCA